MPTTTRSNVLRHAICVCAALSINVPRPVTAATADCSDQKGKVLFDDTFVDDAGGWPSTLIAGATTTFGKPDLTLHIAAPAASAENVNTTFFPKDGDYCLQVKAPTTLSDGSVTTSGMRFIDSDSAGYLFSIYSSGYFVFSQWLNHGWVTIASKQDDKVKPGSLVTLRASVRNGLVTVSGNGQEIKRIRVPIPDTAVRFGIMSSNTKPVSAPGTDFEIVRFRVTAGE